MDIMGKRGGEQPPKPTTASSIRQSSRSEKPEQPTRRVFTAEYKQRVLREVQALMASDDRGAAGRFLRQEGIYWGNVQRWRNEAGNAELAALEPKKRGRKLSRSPSEKEIDRLKRENERLQEKLRKAEIIIDVQKKLSALLGVELPTPPDDEETP